MRLVIQRVDSANVAIEKVIKAEIAQGLLVLVGIEQTDTVEDVDWLVRKLVHMRLFPDNTDRMNKSIVDVGGEILVISQFTLHASTKKGNRPSFLRAAKPDVAIPLYQQFLQTLNSTYPGHVKSGSFGAYMKITLINDGPVTIIIDSKNVA